MSGVDLDHHAHAGAKRRLGHWMSQSQPDRQALHHLDPVAGRILRRQKRKFRTGCLADRRDDGLVELIREGVGVSGQGIEYLRNTVHHMEALGLATGDLKRILQMIDGRIDGPKGG